MHKFLSTSFLLFISMLIQSTNANSSEKFDRVPLKQLESGHYLVVVSLNGRNLNFILDTGSTGSIVDKEVAKRMKLEQLEQHIEGEAAGEPNIETALVRIDSLAVGDNDTQIFELFSQDLSPFKSLHPGSIHGILGQEAIKQLNSVIDLTSEQLLIPKNSSNKFAEDYFKKLQSVELSSHPSGFYTIEVDLDKEIVRLVLDTGAPQILIDETFAKKHFPDRISELKGQYQVSGNGEKQAISLLNSTVVKLGKNSLGNQHMVFDLSNVLSILKEQNKSKAVGVIGLNDLKHLNAKIDLKNQKLYL